MALDVIQRSAEVAEEVLDREPDPFLALTRYLHTIVDLGIGAVIPTLMHHVDLTGPEFTRSRERSITGLQRIVDAAHVTGDLDPRITSGDIGLILVRLSRPLPGPTDEPARATLAHRHLDLFIIGMSTRPRSGTTLAGPTLTARDLYELGVAAGRPPGRRPRQDRRPDGEQPPGPRAR